MEKCFEASYLTIYWQPDGSYLYLKWQGFAGSENFRVGLEQLLVLLEQKKVSHWLNDLSEAGVISLADQDWLAQDWMPRLNAKKLGVTKFATVLPKNIITSMALNRVARQGHSISESQARFDNLEEAVAWLKE